MSRSRMTASSVRTGVPYVVGLIVAVGLFFVTRQIDYASRGDALGPIVWPQFAIGLMALACIGQLLRIRFGRGAATAAAGTAGHPIRAKVLLIGMASIILYGFLLPYLGFLLTSFLFMAAFIYADGYRNHLVVWTASLATVLLVGLLFVRLAYISLPRGVPPFDSITDAVRSLLGG